MKLLFNIIGLILVWAVALAFWHFFGFEFTVIYFLVDIAVGLSWTNYLLEKNDN